MGERDARRGLTADGSGARDGPGGGERTGQGVTLTVDRDGAVQHPAAPRGSLRAVLAYARPHRRILLCTLLLSLLASAAGLVQPLVARAVLDALGAGRSVLRPILLLVALLVAGAALTGLNTWLQERTAQRIVREVRTGLVSRLVRLRVHELDRRPPGDLAARVVSDSTQLQGAATDGLILVVNGALTLIGALVLMATLHAGLLGITVVVLLVVAGALTIVLPRIRMAVTRAQHAVGGIAATIDRALGAARTVKANGAEQHETERVNEAIDEAYEAGLTGARYSALVSMISGASIQLAFLTVLGVGGVLVATDALSVSALIAFLLYVFYLSGPISSLTGGASMLQQGLGAVARIEEVGAMSVEDDVGPLDGAAPTGDGRAPLRGAAAATGADGAPPPDIVLRDVTFAYFDRAPALRDVSFRVPAGTQTALVGPSGAGKTTVLALLQRFYEPQSGEVRLGGTNIATLPRAEVRRRIAYVEQDAPALEGTLRDNLVYAAPDASEQRIWDILRVTALDDLVEHLPEGLETPVGPRGVTLSGGERQRLAIARALLRQPSVLLLDEATAQLDARNEQTLRDAVDRAARRCTVMLIAHRLSTVTQVDQIVVLERGRVRAVGTHRSLMEEDDLYRELATTQLLTPDDGRGPRPAPARGGPATG